MHLHLHRCRRKDHHLNAFSTAGRFCCQNSAASSPLNLLFWISFWMAFPAGSSHWYTRDVLMTLTHSSCPGGRVCRPISGPGAVSHWLPDSGQPAQLQPPTSTARHHCTHHSLELDTCVNPSWNSVQRYRLFHSWTHTSLPSPGHLWGTNRTGKLRYDWAQSPAFTARSNVCEQQARHLEKSNTKHFNVGAGTYSTHAAVYRASQWRGW